MFEFDAPDWRPSEKAPAPCSFFASWPIAWIPVASHPHEAPRYPWSAFWPVRFALSAPACEPTVFDCVTSPPWPVLSTPTGAFRFDAAAWSAA